MKSIFYKYPALYDWGIRFLYFDGLKILKDIVGRNKSVFEPACGYGRMKKYLHQDCTYAGIDLNETFIEYGKKKNRNLRLGNALEPENYREADVILLCDILHHLRITEMFELVSFCARFAREKVVIIEPIFVTIGSKNNPFSRAIGNIMKKMDSDGFNEIERWLSKEEYAELFHSFKELNGMKDMKIRYFRNHDFVEMILK
jgi:SAM-dependent methyltransferase